MVKKIGYIMKINMRMEVASKLVKDITSSDKYYFKDIVPPSWKKI